MMHDEILEPPFLFNAWKHHKSYINDLVKSAKSKQWDGSKLKPYLQVIGNSMIDLYFGELTAIQIGNEIKEKLISRNCWEEQSYARFIDRSSGKYRQLTLSDGSNWTMLWGREVNRHVHIHPSRSSPFTIRVRALALKSAILLLIYHQDYDRNNLIPLLNEVRINFLGASPLKNDVYTRGVKRVLAVLQ